MEEVIPTLGSLEAVAARFVSTLAPAKAGATLITLSGQLGAGKTAFTKAVARVLGVEEVVSSPTFVLEKIYQLAPDKPFRRLIHIDAYRLETGSDLTPLGFDELMKDEGNLILLEWPEKVSDALPAPAVNISIEVLADDTRKIVYG
jgi:tRNA threonylcarbamoyl adenosine modification protein YjeE